MPLFPHTDTNRRFSVYENKAIRATNLELTGKHFGKTYQIFLLKVSFTLETCSVFKRGWITTAWQVAKP
jgi:hypothetical protein